MFINSSNTIRSKILEAALEIDEDYREYIQNRDKYVIPSPKTNCNVMKALR
nr:hypothetical protein [Nitrosopumilus sp.]